jgi:hypothetical protein
VFAQRVLRDQRLQLGDEFAIAPCLKIGVDPLLQCDEATLLESRDVAL